MKAIEQYFPKVLFIMLYKVASTFESVNEILQRDQANGSSLAVLFCGTDCFFFFLVFNKRKFGTFLKIEFSHS